MLTIVLKSEHFKIVTKNKKSQPQAAGISSFLNCNGYSLMNLVLILPPAVSRVMK